MEYRASIPLSFTVQSPPLAPLLPPFPSSSHPSLYRSFPFPPFPNPLTLSLPFSFSFPFPIANPGTK